MSPAPHETPTRTSGTICTSTSKLVRLQSYQKYEYRNIEIRTVYFVIVYLVVALPASSVNVNMSKTAPQHSTVPRGRFTTTLIVILPLTQATSCHLLFVAPLSFFL